MGRVGMMLSGHNRRRSGPEVRCAGFLGVWRSIPVLTALVFLDVWCNGSFLQILVLFVFC